MEFAPTPVFYIFIGLMIGMVIGWVIGFLDSNSRTSKKINAAESDAERKVAQAEQKLALASQTQQDDPGLLRLKKIDGRFTLELDGAQIAGELSNDKRRRLIELITVFRLWLEGGQSSPAASQPAAPINASRPPVSGTAPEAFSPLVESATLPLSQSKKPEPEKNITSLSIVNQIDQVLQTRLTNTSLAKQGIRLQESIQGGVEVYVGLQKFLAVEDLPDEDIKAAIRAAIAEWEKKYTPGM